MSEAAFTFLIRNRIHECAPDQSVETISVGSLREAASTMQELCDALAELVYETTHGSPCEDDGSHKCTISAGALANARAALAKARGKASKHSPSAALRGRGRL